MKTHTATLLFGLLFVCFTSGVSQEKAVRPEPKLSGRHVKEAATAEDIRTLKETLKRQQQEIQSLRQELEERDRQWQATAEQIKTSLGDAQSHTCAVHPQVQSASASTQQTPTGLQADIAEVKTTLTGVVQGSKAQSQQARALTEKAQQFRFAGDIRLRQESSFQSSASCPAPKCDPRIRNLLRARLGIESRVNQDFLAGIYLASGAITNPTSTNENFAAGFDRKTVGLDRGYLVYNPAAHKWLSLTGGKFAPTWQKTTQTFDPDLNPDGFSQRLSFDLEHTGALKNLNATGIELLFNEVSHGPDSYAEGGQVGARLVVGPWTSAPSYTFLNWHRPDALLNEPPSVTGAAAVGPLAPNGMTNSTRVDGGVLRFTGGFFYSDFILDNTIRTPWKRFPLRLLGEYETNLAAAQGNRNRHLYQVVAEVGRSQETRDVLFGYGWDREEQDAVISSFVESEQRAPTNVLQHRIYVQYNIEKNVIFLPTFWIGRTLNSTLQNAQLAPGTRPGQQEPYMKHMEFDLIYKF